MREAFKDLLKNWGRNQDLVFVPEHELTTPAKERRYVDGAEARFNDPKALLRADKENGRIVLDELTVLGNIPAKAWDYRLGKREMQSAVRQGGELICKYGRSKY